MFLSTKWFLMFSVHHHRLLSNTHWELKWHHHVPLFLNKSEIPLQAVWWYERTSEFIIPSAGIAFMNYSGTHIQFTFTPSVNKIAKQIACQKSCFHEDGPWRPSEGPRHLSCYANICPRPSDCFWCFCRE